MLWTKKYQTVGQGLIKMHKKCQGQKCAEKACQRQKSSHVIFKGRIIAK